MAKVSVDFGEYRTVFSLEGVPRARQFVDRPAEMAELERVLIPRLRQSQRQKIQVLHGLGGIGKTQLTVEFARRHHRRFSSVFWLDGRSEDSLKRSIARCAGRIPQGQVPETSRTYAADNGADVDAVVRDVMAWLARPDNTAWLLIFDNVDREYKAQGGDADAYDIERYFSGADHGSVLVTTRLARLEQLGESKQLGKLSKEQGQAIFESWYKEKHGKQRTAGVYIQMNKANKKIVDTAESEKLLTLLDGLPLAIAQAGAYLQESGVGLRTYLRFYEQQWSDLMKSDHLTDSPLQDYPDRSVWTTWAISYQAIRNKHEHTANLLLLWSFLDNKDLWHGLFAAAYEASVDAARMLSAWIGEIASSELAFHQAIRLLRNYSLVEAVEVTTSFATHPVVHRWAYHHQGKHSEKVLGQIAVIVVGWAAPDPSNTNWSGLQRRLLPHAQACSSWVLKSERRQGLGGSKQCELCSREDRADKTLLVAISRMGLIYYGQGKLPEAVSLLKAGVERNGGGIGIKAQIDIRDDRQPW